MSNLKQLIKQEVEKDSQLLNRLATIAKLKSPTPLRKFIYDDKVSVDFQILVTIVKELFPTQEQALMNSFCRTLNTNKTLARHALEYASLNRLDHLRTYLIEQLLQSKNKINREWAFVHSLDTQISTDKKTNLNIINELNQRKYKSFEMKLFSKMVGIYCYYSLTLYEDLERLAAEIHYKLPKIKDPFINNSYRARYGLIMTGVSAHFGDSKKVQEFGNQTLTFSEQPSLRCIIHLHLGNSYIYSDFDQALFHFHKAQDNCIHAQKLIEIKRSLNFLHTYWGKHPDYLDHNSTAVSDIHEVAFYYIKQGKTHEGLERLNSVEWINLTSSQKGFNLYFKGIALNNRDYLFESIRYFNEAGDRLYKKLPLKELTKMGESKDILNALL